MAYQIAAMAVTLNDREGHSSVAGLFKCSLSNICAAFYTISTDSVLAHFLCISRASCYYCNQYNVTFNILVGNQFHSVLLSVRPYHQTVSVDLYSA